MQGNSFSGSSLVVKEIEEWIIKKEMGYQMDPIDIQRLSYWKSQIIAEIQQSRLDGIKQGMELIHSPKPIRKILGG